jgi:putative colanic acid biosynthesis acetyltransferase WcaF
MSNTVDLSKFDKGDYNPGPKGKILLWSFFNYFILNAAFPWPQAFKRKLLILFGAKIGTGLILKIKVRVKYPWRLIIGNNCWIGESVWIDNLENVTLGNNVCLSQGAVLLTGNHDYKMAPFPYRLGAIILEDGVWIGAQSVVCAGVICKSHSILTVNSVAGKNLDAWGIYSGNPAVFMRKREIIS